MKNKEIIIPILNNEYKVIVCCGNEEFIKKVGESWNYPGGVEMLEKVRGNTCTRKGCNPIIILHRYPKRADEIGTLAHEAIHAICNIWDMIGEENTSEVFAHSIGAIVRNTLQEGDNCLKCGKKIKP